jgi:hypothetical protein
VHWRSCQVREVLQLEYHVDAHLLRLVLLNKHNVLYWVPYVEVREVLSKEATPELAEIQDIIDQEVEDLSAGDLYLDTLAVLIVDVQQLPRQLLLVAPLVAFLDEIALCQLEYLLIQLILQKVLTLNGIGRIPHLVGNRSVDQWEQLLFSCGQVIHDLARDVYNVQHF